MPKKRTNDVMHTHHHHDTTLTAPTTPSTHTTTARTSKSCFCLKSLTLDMGNVGNGCVAVSRDFRAARNKLLVFEPSRPTAAMPVSPLALDFPSALQKQTWLSLPACRDLLTTC